MADVEIIEALRTAHERGERPSAQGANLYGADLSRADLRSAVLRSADLRSADLSGADLRSANLSRADLSRADLRSAVLRLADLSGADLRSADLRSADLSRADLRSADLRWANLTTQSTILSAVLPSGPAIWWATPKGWQMRIGCWTLKRVFGPDAIAALRDLMAGDDWPEARGEERDRRRPSLEAWIAQCEAHAAYWPSLVPDLAERWGGEQS